MANVLVYATGLGLEHAIALGKVGNNVRYFTPWFEAFPKRGIW